MRTAHHPFVVLAAVVGLSVAACAAAAQSRGGEEPVVAIGSDYVVAAGERVQDAVVVGGSLTIEGEVESDAVAVMGDVTLAGTARVEGDFVVVLGSATIEPGAAVDGDLVVVAGSLDAPSGFRAGGEQVVVAAGLGAGSGFGAVAPWFREGLFWGRPFVPGLGWMWVLAALFLLLYVALNVVFAGPVRACTHVLNDKPLTAGLGGLLVLLLVGPVSIILAVSVVGLIVIPFLLCAVVLAGVFGRVAAARWIGGRIMAEQDPEDRWQATRSVLIGAALVGAIYLVPVLGIVTWAVLGVFGIGAVAAVTVTALRRENASATASAASSAAPPAADAASAVAAAAPMAGAQTVEDGPVAPAQADAPPHAAADLSVHPRADFGSRFGALALDVLLLGISAALLNIEDGWAFFLIIAYHVGFWAWKGTTIGGIVCRVRVVRPDGAPVGFTEALVRGLSAIFSVAVAGLGWFWMLWDPERQTWHDKIAGTIVVRVPTSVTLP